MPMYLSSKLRKLFADLREFHAFLRDSHARAQKNRQLALPAGRERT
jgi:hypothetical protein